MNRVLIVDDDPDVRELYSVALSEAGFDILQAADGVGAIAAYHANSPDLVLLDIGLGAGSIDGLEVCRRLRAVTDTPIVLLTSRDEEIDQLTGLHVGADDYLTKTISLRLLTAKVAAVLRRSALGGGNNPPAALAADGLRIDLEGRTVSFDGKPVSLTRIEFDLLAALAENPGRVLTREQLVERVWGDWFGDDHHLDVHLSRLRAKVKSAGGPRLAHAVRGVGFRLKG